MDSLIRDFLKANSIIDFPDGSIATNTLRIVDGNVILSGNRLGLIELADYILGIALSKGKGSHIHLDENNFFDDTDNQLIIELDEEVTFEST